MGVVLKGDIWTDIRIADIIPNGSDICSTADIPELGEIAKGGKIK